MAAGEERPRTSREETAQRIRRGIRAAQLRVVLDEALGRPTPEAVVRLAQLRMPSPIDALRSPDGKLPKDPASRREVAPLYTPRNPSRATEGCPGRGPWSHDSRGREETGPDEASIAEVEAETRSLPQNRYSSPTCRLDLNQS